MNAQQIGRSAWLVTLCALFATAACAQPASCPPEEGVALQVLGSGGPIADDGRASSGYLVWIDGRARVLIDAGGGTFLRFGEAGASFDDLEFVGISHFHTDHSADLPALLKSGYFSRRSRSLAVAGPTGRGAFPGLRAYLDAMLGEGGSYAYLGGYLDGSGGLVPLEIIETAGERAKRLKTVGALSVEALSVPHGIVPALAFRVRYGDRSIVFASDQNGGDPGFTEFAQGADVLVAHMAVGNDPDRIARRLHATPEVWGDIASSSESKHLILSHFMARSLRQLDAAVDAVEAVYAGTVTVAEDLVCIGVPAD